MALPPRFLDQLRDRLTLSEVVGGRVRLTRAGREFKGRCPFHKEKTPSFYVNDDKQFYHCFGCGAHGDAVGFAMRHDNLSFIEAVEHLAAKAGLEVPRESPQEVERQKHEKDLYALLECAGRFFEDQLRSPAHRDAFGYLENRGVSETTLSAFRLGFAPADGQALRTHLQAQGYQDHQMIEAGIMHMGKDGRPPYAFFRDRIMFPVSDRRGRIIAFGGRILPETLRPPARGDYKPPKYINSSDNPLFHKGKNLYGQAQARAAVANGQPLIVVEGNIDVIAAHQAGFSGTVAPLGTALTENQILEIWKMIPTEEKIPVLCFDGDEAGRRAAARAAERILPLIGPDRSVRIAFLPEGEDPDSLLVSRGKKAFADVIEAAVSLIDVLWAMATKGRSFSTPESRAGLSERLESQTLKIADRNVQYHYRRAFGEKLRAAFSGHKPASGTGRKAYPAPGRPAAAGARTVAPAALLLRPLPRPHLAGEIQPMVLVATFVNHPRIFAQIEERLLSLDMKNKRLGQLLQSAIDALQRNPDLDNHALCRHLDAAGFREEMAQILSESVYRHAGFARSRTPESEALSGWMETCALIDRQSLVQEIRAAGQLLAGSFTTENEDRLQALHGMTLAKEG